MQGTAAEEGSEHLCLVSEHGPLWRQNMNHRVHAAPAWDLPPHDCFYGEAYSDV